MIAQKGKKKITTAAEDTEEVRKFFDGWGLYWKAVDHDYTGHKKIYACLNDFLRRHFPRSFALANFSYGNASYMVRGLAGTKVAKYLGVDLSEVALGLARENLVGLGYETEFIQGDYAAVAGEGKIRVDVVWIGLSFHHLSRAQKGACFADCHRILNPGGCLLIFEPVLLPGEKREEFVERWWKVCREKWEAFSREEKEQTYRHVAAADFPETLETYRALALGGGFKSAESLCREETGLYELISFIKNNRIRILIRKNSQGRKEEQ